MAKKVCEMFTWSRVTDSVHDNHEQLTIIYDLDNLDKKFLLRPVIPIKTAICFLFHWNSTCLRNLAPLLTRNRSAKNAFIKSQFALKIVENSVRNLRKQERSTVLFSFRHKVSENLQSSTGNRSSSKLAIENSQIEIRQSSEGKQLVERMA